MAQEKKSSGLDSDVVKLTVIGGVALWLLQLMSTGTGQQVVQTVQSCCAGR